MNFVFVFLGIVYFLWILAYMIESREGFRTFISWLINIPKIYSLDFVIFILIIFKVRGDKSAKLSVQPWAGESTLQSIVAHTTRDIKAKVDR